MPPFKATEVGGGAVDVQGERGNDGGVCLEDSSVNRTVLELVQGVVKVVLLDI